MYVVTAVVNNPLFIEIQYHTLKKYFLSEYEFIVFNDAKDFPDFTNGGDVSLKNQIEDICKKLQIQCINIPNNHHRTNKDPAVRCADSMNYILRYQKDNPDKYLVLDSDMFLVDYFDINVYANYDCAIVLHSRNNYEINYIWNGIFYFDMTKMKNKELLNWNCCTYCDVGGMMQEWLKKQMGDTPMPNTNEIRLRKDREFHTNNIYFIRYLPAHRWDIREFPGNLARNKKLIDFCQRDVRNSNNKFFCEIYDNVFFHYRSGGNWRQEGMKIHTLLSQCLKNCLL